MKKKYFAWIRLLLIVLALVFAVSLLFSVKQQTSSDTNVLFVLDVSNSMNARDIIQNDKKNLSDVNKLSRLDLAKEFIQNIMASESDVQYGLLVFWQSAVTLVPATADTGSFIDHLLALNTNILPGGWTNWGSFDSLISSREEYSKIIFFSDADEWIRTQKFEWAENAKKYFVGIWTEGGAVVRYANDNILRSKGKNVYSSLDIDVAESLSSQLDADLFIVESLESIDSVINDIVWDSVKFSFVQFNILLILLTLCVLFVL